MKTILLKIEARVTQILEAEVRMPVASKTVETFHEYLKNSKGQMRRSMLMALLMRGLGKKEELISDKTIEIAAIGEMIHFASLLHDDVIDLAKTRRGQPTFHAQYGNKNAILFGDALLAVSLQKLGQVEGADFFLPLYIQVVKDLAMGEILQYEWEGKMSISMEVYEQIILGKTGALFAAFSASAAFLALGSQKESQSFHNFGSRFGKFYQLRDDSLDCFLIENGKDPKNDFVNHHATYPLVLLCSRVSKSEYRHLQDSWGNEDDYGFLMNMLKKYNVYEEVQACLDTEVDVLLKFTRENLESSAFLQLESYLQELRLPRKLPTMHLS